jgi:hypothetical protein
MSEEFTDRENALMNLVVELIRLNFEHLTDGDPVLTKVALNHLAASLLE